MEGSNSRDRREKTNISEQNMTAALRCVYTPRGNSSEKLESHLVNFLRHLKNRNVYRPRCPVPETQTDKIKH